MAYITKDEIEALKADLHKKRNELKRCPFCNASIEDRLVTVSANMAQALHRVYRWCGEHRQHEFRTSDIKHLLTQTDYARFGDLIECSNGILYRPKDKDSNPILKGAYGMHMERAREFFHGSRTMHTQVLLDQITGDRVAVLKETTLGGIPEIHTLLTKDGLYDHRKLL